VTCLGSKGKCGWIAYSAYVPIVKILKHLMWRAAYCTYPQAWEKVMLEIKEVNDDAFKHLMVIPPRQVFDCCLSLCIFSVIISIFLHATNYKRYWSRSRFTTS